MTDIAASPKQEPIAVLEDLLRQRYSCRAYRPDPVPRPTIDRILAAAQRTASWCNSQPWQVVIASGAAKATLPRCDLRRGQFRRPGGRRFCVSPRISRRLSGAAARKRLPALQHPRHRARRQGGLCPAGPGEFQFLRRAACRHHSHRRGARHLWCDRLRRLCRQFPAGGAGAGPRRHPAGGAGVPLRPDPSPFRARRQPAGGVRNFVRLSGSRPQDQQLPHFARRHCRHRNLRRRVGGGSGGRRIRTSAAAFPKTPLCLP